MPEKTFQFDKDDVLDYSGKRRHWMTHSGILSDPEGVKISDVKIKLSKDEADIYLRLSNEEKKLKVRIDKDSDHWDVKENDEKVFRAHKKRGSKPGVVMQNLQDKSTIIIYSAGSASTYYVFKYNGGGDEINVDNIPFDKLVAETENILAIFEANLGNTFKVQVKKSQSSQLPGDTLSILFFFFLVMNRVRPRNGNAGALLASGAVGPIIATTTAM